MRSGFRAALAQFSCSVLLMHNNKMFWSAHAQVKMVKDADAQRQVCKDMVAEAVSRNNK